MSGVQDYRLYAGSELRLLERSLETPLQAWGDAWAGMPGEFALAARAVGRGERESPAVFHPFTGQGHAGALHAPDDPAGVWLAWQCFGCAVAALPAGNRLVDATLGAALQALCRGLAVTPDRLAIADGQDRSGAVLLTIDRAGHSLDVLLPAACVASHLPARQPASDVLPPLLLSQARLANPVVLEVTARSASFSVEELMTASAGDILRLDHRVDDPFDIRLAGGGVVGQGLLGRKHDRLAVKFLPLRQEAR